MIRFILQLLLNPSWRNLRRETSVCPKLLALFGRSTIRSALKRGWILWLFFFLFFSDNVWPVDFWTRLSWKREGGQQSFGRLSSSASFRLGTEVFIQFSDEALSRLKSGQLSFSRPSSPGNLRLGTENIFQFLDEALFSVKIDQPSFGRPSSPATFVWGLKIFSVSGRGSFSDGKRPTVFWPIFILKQPSSSDRNYISNLSSSILFFRKKGPNVKRCMQRWRPLRKSWPLRETFLQKSRGFTPKKKVERTSLPKMDKPPKLPEDTRAIVPFVEEDSLTPSTTFKQSNTRKPWQGRRSIHTAGFG